MLLNELFSLLGIITVSLAQDGSVGRRVPSFIGTRGKKSEVDAEKEIAAFDFEPTDKVDEHLDDVRYPMTKRAQIGFQGTRGKKMADNTFKRALGFTGTRGKKYDSYLYPKIDLDDYWLIGNELAKRKFYGMRGKKLPYPYSVVGVRGKKGPSNSAFFGTRGKKDTTSNFNKDDENTGENLATILYLLTNKDFPKYHHTNDDFDFQNSDTDSQFQEGQAPVNEGYSA